MKFYTYIHPGPFSEGDILVWDRVREEVRRWGGTDELILVRSLGLTRELMNRLMEWVPTDQTMVTGAPSHPLLKSLFFDGQLRMGRIAVGDDGSVQVRPRIWSDRNKDFRLDMDNVDGEDVSTFGETMKTFRLLGWELAKLQPPAVAPVSPREEASTAWGHLLDDDGL